jgi:aspartate racemase
MQDSLPSKLKHTPTVGIMGGLGPAATIDFMQRLLRATPAGDDGDHYRQLVDNNAKVPSRIKAILEGGDIDPLPMLIEMGKNLEAGGADFLAMPCNTAHFYHQGVQEQVSIPFLHMPNLALQAIHEKLHSDNSDRLTVALLASPALQKVKLFESYAEPLAIDIIYPQAPQQTQLLEVIQAIKAGATADSQETAFKDIATEVQSLGADALLVCCSELSLLTGVLREAEQIIFPVFDSIEELVNKSLKFLREISE